ncbi:MAG: Gfo/Idh/MocA family oxidoreductase [Planctomycetes bacterium]|nr:Gfo/Idh/MocA family oxidoreductase [Planctomycetota bacterium]
MSAPSKITSLKVGIIGIVRGYWFIQALKHTSNIELAALCARDNDKLKSSAKKWGLNVKLYTSYEQMLASDIDAVIVATPVPLHAEHAIAALNAGKHVLSEVPAASNLEDCQRLLQAARISGRVYMLAENFCYMRPWSLVKRLVEEGRFGEIFYGEGKLLAPISFKDPQDGYHWYTDEWAMRKGHQYSTHFIGPLCQVFGERITGVSCLGSGQHYHDWAGGDDTSAMLCRTESGKLISLRVDFYSHRPDANEGLLEIQGTKGCCRISPGGGNDRQEVYFHGVSQAGKWQSLWEYSEYLDKKWHKLPAEILAKTFDSGLPFMLADFATAALGNTPPALDILFALNITAPGLLSEISSHQGGAFIHMPQYLI